MKIFAICSKRNTDIDVLRNFMKARPQAFNVCDLSSIEAGRVNVLFVDEQSVIHLKATHSDAQVIYIDVDPYKHLNNALMKCREGKLTEHQMCKEFLEDEEIWNDDFLTDMDARSVQATCMYTAVDPVVEYITEECREGER